MKKNDLEKYSSAITLSDMEVFVFPELMYSLVLANIMSPILWKWREDATFKKLRGKSPYRKLLRLRQYIMDEYDFNLDLETWGMTDQATELKRFSPFISPEQIADSNALFGYTGDKYYFDVDIRRHFGLDKYGTEVIPYWKTETIEAMGAFLYREGYDKRAGECVSLSTLYAAAAFVVCGIPLEDIFMVLTPLHSQNYIDLNGGVITNNRRVVTKPMWFNGTEISTKAQRALRNEQVTVVSHCSGYVHCMYDAATIDKGQYERLTEQLGEYLNAKLDMLMFSNFLRSHGKYQKYFQFCREHRGQKRFVKADVLYSYEHGSRFRIADDTYDKLLDEVSEEDYSPYKDAERMCCEQFRAFVEYENVNLQTDSGRDKLRDYLRPLIEDVDVFMEELVSFLHIDPRLPSCEKEYCSAGEIILDVEMDRDQVINALQGMRENNIVADLAFYAYRDMSSCEWEPFVKACVERNPVSIEMADGMSEEQVYSWLGGMINESIYDGKRLSQPDEVCNYGRGDGLEKAMAMANILLAGTEGNDVEIVADQHDIVVKSNSKNWRFVSSKGLARRIIIRNDGQAAISEI